MSDVTLVSPPRRAGIRAKGEGPDMKRSRFTEEQIIGVLRDQEAGAVVGDLCRKHGMSSAMFYAWMDAGRMPQRAPVLLNEPCPRHRRRLGRGLQHRAAALGDRLHDACRLRRDPETATATRAPPARQFCADAHCYCRAHAQFSNHDSSDPRMNVGGSCHFQEGLRRRLPHGSSPETAGNFGGMASLLKG
jgi:hypothetical protein